MSVPGMIFENPKELKERVERMAGRRVYGAVQVVEDTSNYMSIYGGMVLRLAGIDYFVTGDATEARFGIDDQPKFWVKYAVDLTDGAKKILKLVFHESFQAKLGPATVRCVRRPEKESEVLDLVAGDARFMQGRTVQDCAGNNVRIIDRIRGDTLYNHVAVLEQSHEEYFHDSLPAILDKVVGCIEALAFLHEHGQQHGDVRNDHIMIERDSGAYRWIDFDYWVNYLDYEVWCVGNVLTYVVGKGIIACRDATRELEGRSGAGATIEPGDALVLFPHRLANLRKLYPYIPETLNEQLMRFSASAFDFYEDVTQVIDDLREYLARAS